MVISHTWWHNYFRISDQENFGLAITLTKKSENDHSWVNLEGDFVINIQKDAVVAYVEA